MHGRRLACLIAFATVVAPTLAEGIPEDATDDAGAVPFILRTHVIAPHRVGDFVLEDTHYDPANKFAGVSIRYVLPGHEETRFDLFVYPQGLGDTEQVLDSGMHVFRATLDMAAGQGRYRALKVDEAVEFDVPLQAPAGRAEAGKDEQLPFSDTQAPAATDDELARTLATLAATERHVDGRRMDMQYEYPGDAEGEWWPMRSRGYLFYRHLYFFKGRTSAMTTRIDADAFAALTDRAMRELVPAVQAYNVGSCHDNALQVDPTAPEGEMADALVREIFALQARNEAANCHAPASEGAVTALARDADVVTIEYEPHEWGAE